MMNYIFFINELWWILAIILIGQSFAFNYIGMKKTAKWIAYAVIGLIFFEVLFKIMLIKFDLCSKITW